MKETISEVRAQAYTVPTDFPESDGTLEWNSTTIVLVEIDAAGKTGIGYTYGDSMIASFILKSLKELVCKKNIFENTAITESLIHAIRNNGSCGLAMMAVSAIDCALWDLKAKILDVPLCILLGKIKDEILIYGSGGFTSYSNKQLHDQLRNWVESGIRYVKIKIGREPEHDCERVEVSRDTIGNDAGLFVDANGAYDVKQALDLSEKFSEFNVTWFEEPVTSDNLEGLKFIRERTSEEMNIAAGEYGYTVFYFEKMLAANAVDVLQADATRCGGITGFLKAGTLAEAHQIPFSSHCAPSLHLHASLSLNNFFISEYFHDHVRIEEMFFDGMARPENGLLKPDLSRAGFGLDFKRSDAEKFLL